ncbi:MAG: hypothetical protein BAJATHORv1_10561 [Candidatus Thorarchaeota archaeon]|nr:MAG: hypothetical protein BAJATHORv1_10561 [Candidatus Thorarchaeota archaeon]
MSFLTQGSDRETKIDKRKVNNVPFVELHDGRLQGVVSSGSSKERVYLAFIKANSHDYYCSTNNNRRCGGLRGTYCKHLRWLLEEAVKQFGAKKVAEYLKLPTNPESVKSARNILALLHGSEVKESISEVFSRFLGYLRYLEVESVNEYIPEMAWFF